MTIRQNCEYQEFDWTASTERMRAIEVRKYGVELLNCVARMMKGDDLEDVDWETLLYETENCLLQLLARLEHYV